MVPDYETSIYAAIRQLCENYTDWANSVPIQNRIWFDQVSNAEDPTPTDLNDGDYPRSELRLVSGTDGMYTDDETFDTYSLGGPHTPWLEKSSRTFRLKLTSQLLKQGEPDQLNALSRNALRKGGPRLGLDYVDRVRLSWRLEEVDIQENSQLRRWRTTIDIIVDYTIDGSTLTGA